MTRTDLEIVQGDTEDFIFRLSLTGAEDLEEDFAGWTLTMTARAGGEELFSQAAPVDYDGVATVSLSSDQTRQVAYDADYDAQIDTPSGARRTILRGTLHPETDVTR